MPNYITTKSKSVDTQSHHVSSMTSTSSSSTTYINSSRPNHTKYDVFISFRGEDTRYSFTDHLRDALIRAGISTLRDDDQILRGQDLAPELVKSIQSSRASIVVLSKNYANSSWCLEELSLILEQRRKGHHFVLPVFYHVDPSDVRQHRGSFSIKWSNWTVENVNRWKSALTEVANMSGMIASGPEAQFIEEIVETVDHKLVSILPVLPTGMETVAKDMYSLLNDERSNTNVLAICGMGGSGKTTLAQYLYSSNKHNFERSCFLEDIGLHFKKTYGLLELQYRLLRSVLGGRVRMLNNVDGASAKINRVLQGIKVLLVLDGIDEHDDLRALLGTNVVHTESKIIITTRLLDINSWFESTSWRCHVHELKLLNHHESLEVQENMKIPLEVIQLATENFDKKYCIGKGGYGEVYKAELNNFNSTSYLALKLKSKDELSKMSCMVAIKRIISREDGQGKEGFLAELDVLSRCEHPNIVSLLGCCVEGSEMLLVYEHASKGSLDDYLESTDKVVNLTWTQRLKMCIDIAQGLNYLHTNMADNSRIIHRDIKSANILLGENWEAKISDFGLSKSFPVNHQASTINTNMIAGTSVYLDPEYDRTGSLKRASDIYSFGVVLFEIFTGKLAYDPIYIKEKKRGLAPIAKRHFEMGTLVKEMLDPNTMDNEVYELGLTLKIRPDHDSLDAFSRIAYQCLAKSQAERPTIEVVINELNKALYFQENRMTTLRISLDDIKMGVENFSDDNCIIRGKYGMLYKGKVQHNDGHKEVVVKRFIRSAQEDGFLKEFEVLFKYRQVNIIGLVGYCKEMDENIIVYDHASMGSLNEYLTDTSFTWIKRLKICIDIANGLQFLHGGDVGQDVVIHGDVKSANIILTKDWKAKICGFEHALTYPQNKKIKYVIIDVAGSPGYCDPLFLKTHIITKESDIYSFGVILFEILCGKLACPEDVKDHDPMLDVLVKRHYEAALLEEIVFEGIKKQIVLKSFATFRKIAFQCLNVEREERPTASDVVIQLQKALEFQEAYELRKAKLDRTYKEMLNQFSSESPQSYSTMGKRDIYSILSKGFLLEDDKLITQAYEDYHPEPDAGPTQ